jgi:ubiquinone/menaquinone biosynthesis C-methylase UbiE
MPFSDSSFDRIYCSEVLEHVQNPNVVCEEIKRLLSDDGLFVASVPYEKIIDLLKAILYKFSLYKIINKLGVYKISYKMTDEWHLQEFTPKNFSNLLENNFEVMKFSFAPCRLIPLRMIALCRKIR